MFRFTCFERFAHLPTPAVWLSPRRCATSLSDGHWTWGALEEAGFSRVEQLRSEVGSPMQLVSCLTPRSSALRSLRGFTDPTTCDHLKEFEVSRRVDRKHAMRYKLQEVRRTLAKRKSGRGICGSSCSLSFRFCLFVVLVDYKEPLCFLMSF